MKHLLYLLVLSAFAYVGPSSYAKPVPELPVETLFASPSITQLRFSPGGRYIAALMPKDRRMNLVIMDLETKSKAFITGFKDFDIASFLWLNDDRLVMLMDDDGDEAYETYVIDRTGKNFEKMGPAASLVARNEKDSRKIMVNAYVSYRDVPDVCWLDVKTGKLTIVAKNPGNVDSWVIDHDYQVRFGIIETDELEQRILYREKNGDDWAEVGRFKDGEASWSPLAFDGDNQTCYVKSDIGRKTAAVYKYDTKSGKLGELVGEDDVYDVERVIWSKAKKRIVGYSYTADRHVSRYFDADYKHRQEIIDTSLPGYVNVQQEASEDASKIVIFSSSDREPGVYYIYNDKQKKIEELAVLKPQIDPEQMSRMLPVTYPARDGLLIHAFLTLPMGREPKNLPLVINPHGGPFGIRDDWGFSPEVQLLANRGFAVLQPNYRGSGGYGLEFERKGYRLWGRAMQDDLSDAVKWAVDQGYADPSKVVILGASYGGYAVMAGLAFTPELYCAGVNYVGVTDLKIITSQGRGTNRAKYWRKTRIGDLFEDKDELNARSPVNYAEAIRAPVLMAYGKMDPRVTREHGDDMKAALAEHGKTYEFVLESNEGHGFRKAEKSIAYYTKVDEFLKKYVLTKPE